MTLLSFLLLARLAVGDQACLQLDGMWIGGTVSQFAATGLTGRPAIGPSGESSMLYGESQAFFDEEGKANLILGESLSFNGAALVHQGQTREQVVKSFSSIGWPKDGEKRVAVDVGTREYDVFRYRSPYGTEVWVAFSGWPGDTVGTLVLRGSDSWSPFGDI